MKPKIASLFMAGMLALSGCALIMPAATPPAAIPPTQAPPTPAPSAAVQAEPTATVSAPSAAWASVSCDTFNVGPEVAAVADCGIVTIPESRTSGSDRQIKLAVVRVKSGSKTPGAPIVLGTGGPGGPALQAVQGPGGPGFLAAYGPILADRDFVLFSQRGTALAEPVLDCPAYNALTLKASTEGMTIEARGNALRDALVTCAQAYKAQGVDLAAYNSNENADDVDSIRQALGYDKIFYYGESYGTQLGQFVLRRHPDILAGIMLDGIVPITVEQTPLVSNIPGAFQTVFEACAADAACNAAYPDIETMLIEAIDRLREQTEPYTFLQAGQAPMELKVDDLLAMNALFINLYIPGGYAKLPEMIKQLHEGNLAPMASTLPFVIADSDNARVMHYAINCTDDPTPSLDALGRGDMPQAYARFVASDDQNYANICPALALPQLPADSDAPVQSDLPALLIQGGLDPATPRSGGLKVGEGLPNSTEILVPSGNHVQFNNPCVIDIVRKFMEDPAAKPDQSCIDTSVTFKVPAPVSYAGPDASTAVSITLPPTFWMIGEGQWTDNQTSVSLSSYPATKTVEAVLSETITLFKLENPKVGDGPTIAGMSSSLAQAEVNGSAWDVYVFGDKLGTYRVAFHAINGKLADFVRKQVYPGKLASVTVGPALATSAAEGTNKPMEATSANTPRLRALDFAPFEKDLAAFTPERAAAVDAIVKDADIAQVQDAVKAGKLTYTELTLYFLARIRRYDETLRTMVELNPDALKEAQAADQRLKDGKATGLLVGIPVTLKDNIETAAPMRTTGGAEILLNNQPKADASFVKQLREAGAVILGKANLSELAGGVSSNAGSSAVGGQVVNPHGNYSPAGSSAGSGTGTAAYLTLVSVGSETSGSLIVPSSYNGVVGMYPGRGVVDGANVIPLVKNNDSAGPMGRSVKDVAALLGVIDTTDTDYVADLDANALNGVTAVFLKSDVLAQKPNALEDNSDNAAVAQLIEKSLAQAGAKVTDIELTPAGIGTQFNVGAILVGGVRHDMVSYLVAAGAPIKTLEDLAAYNLKEPKTRIPYGQGTIDAALQIADLNDVKVYEDATKQLKEMAIAALDAAFADHKADVLVSVNNYHSSFYATANYPAISVPLGKRANGMPVGVTLIGKPGSEAKLLAYAYALEQATKLRVDPDLSKVAPDNAGDDGEGAVAGLQETLAKALGSLSYRGLSDDREITLAGGVFTETSDAGTIVVHLLDQFIAPGDLNGDGATDAVALLELDTGGSGRFIYAAPVLDVLTKPSVGLAVMVEDRIQPTALTIADGQVVLGYIGHGEGDGECCPSWNIRHTFAWKNDALVEVSREEVSKVEASATNAFGAAWKTVSCDTFHINKDVAESSDCGYVTVPERHENPDGPTIQLGVVRIRSVAEKPADDPILFEQGGPGGSTLGYFASPGQIVKMLNFLKARDAVLVEERGTQYSIPYLDCPEKADNAIAVAKGQAKDDGSYMNACKARWDKQGIDLSAYSDKQNAADMYAVVDALGYKQFNYYGVSYGTELGQFVMKAATDHPGLLRSVILDGVVPVDVQDEPIKDQTASQSLRTMFAACAQDAECNKTFPDLEKKTLALLDKLDATPIVVTATLPSGEKLPVSVKGEDLFTMLFSFSYNPLQISHLPGILDTMIQKNDFSWVAKQKSGDFGPGGPAEGMHLAMKCPRIERQPLVPAELFEAAYPQANIAKPALADYQRRCKIMDVTSAQPDEFTYPTEDIPTLILSGAMDPATPPQFGAHVGSQLKTSHVYTMPDGAHGVVWSSPTLCALSIAVAFLADPAKAPDASCIQTLKPVFAPRVTPLDEMKLEARTVITGITAKLPTVFTSPQGNGLYSDPADPINAPTGIVGFYLVEAATADAALAFPKDAKVVAADQKIGNYHWKIVESGAIMKGVLVRGAVTKLADGKHFLKVIIGGPQDNADAIFAALWEPIVSSIKAQ